MENSLDQVGIARGYLGELIDATPNLVHTKDVLGNSLAARCVMVSKFARQFPELIEFWSKPGMLSMLDLYIRAHYSLWDLNPDKKIMEMLDSAGLLGDVIMSVKIEETEDQYLERIKTCQNAVIRALFYGECRYMLHPQNLVKTPEEYREGIIQQYNRRIEELGMSHLSFQTDDGQSIEVSLTELR